MTASIKTGKMKSGYKIIASASIAARFDCARRHRSPVLPSLILPQRKLGTGLESFDPSVDALGARLDSLDSQPDTLGTPLNS